MYPDDTFLDRRQALRALAVAVCVFVTMAPPASSEWWLWESPHDNAEVADQQQTAISGYRGMQNGHGLGQSFVPQADVLYRIDFMIKNRYDLRPFEVRLWRWVDSNGDGRTEDEEYDATVAAAPLWHDELSIPGQEDRVLVTLYPRLAVAAGLPYYIEFTNNGLDGEWGVFVTGDPIDPYPGGGLRVNGHFQYVPEFGEYMDMYFRTYSEPAGSPPPLECGESGQPAPCFSPAAAWEPPDPPGPPPTAEDYRSIVQSKIDSVRDGVLNGNGRWAHQYAMYDAFLYRVTGDEAYAQNVVGFFEKATIWRRAYADDPIHFGWGEHTGWAYKWVLDSPSLSGADHRMIRTLLLHSGMLLWSGRDLGLNNHSLGRALSYKLITELVSPGEFAALSACVPGPPPSCELFKDGEHLDAADHAAWQAYALDVWSEFTTEWDLLEDACRYDFYDLQFVLQLALLYDEYETMWNDPGFRELVDRLYHYFLPLGAFPIVGDTSGWSMAWGSPIWLFEQAATTWQDPKYKWLAYRLYDYRRTHLKNARLDGNPVELWESVFEEYPAFCHAYFAIDPTVPVVQPAGQTEQPQARQDQVEDDEWAVTSDGLGQTFTVTARPLVRIDLKVRNAGDTTPAAVRLWEWKNTHAATVSEAPLYAGSIDLSGPDLVQDRSLFPFLDVSAGTTYYVELARGGTFYILGSASGSGDVYTGGRLWYAGSAVDDADLWFRTHTLSDDGSQITWRLGATPRLISQRGFPPRTHDLGDPVPDKLILRSGYDSRDLHAVVNLVAGGHFHGQLETAAIVSLANAGSALLVDSAYLDRREKDQNKLMTRRYWGGTHRADPDPLSVSRFLDYRGATVAWVDWGDPHGWSAEHHRRFFFVKNRFLLVRDRSTFTDSMTASTGNVWHAYDVHPEHGSNWYSLYDREPIGQHGWLFKNPEQYVLLHMADRPGYEFAEWEVEQVGVPASPRFNVSQRWVGDGLAGETRWFDSLLLPHGAELTPAQAAGHVEVIYDDGANVAYRIVVDNETWTVLDNPGDLPIDVAGLRTDARYLIAATRPGGAHYVLTHEAGQVEIDNGPGRSIRLAWPLRTSVEISDTSFVQDWDGDGAVDARDVDDDGDGVEDDADDSPFDAYACRDVDGDGCDDCSSGLNDPAADGPDLDLDGACDAGDNCPAQLNTDQFDGDGDGLGDVCDVCPDVYDPSQADADGDAAGDSCDNCPLDRNAGQWDVDDDTEGDHCDVDDGLVYVFAPSAETVTWQDEVGVDQWNCYRGDLGVLRSSGVYTQPPGSNALADRHCGLDLPFVTDLTTPGTGDVAFYLVTGVSGAVESDLGTDDAGVTRPNTAPCP